MSPQSLRCRCPSLLEETLAAVNAATPQKARSEGWRTPTSRNPDIRRRLGKGRWGDDSLCVGCCGRDESLPVRLRSSWIGTLGKPYIYTSYRKAIQKPTRRNR